MSPHDDAAVADRLARVALSAISEPGDTRLAALAAEIGATLLHAHLLAERDVSGLHTDLAARLGAAEPERLLADAARQGVRFVTPTDAEWPSQLDALAGISPIQERGGIPLGLWVRGPLRLDELSGAVAVVGSRSATTYGADVAAEIAAIVGRTGRCIVSGAAFGIDQAAHRGAIAAGGPTIAVLACGADRIYPAAHHQLIEHIAAEGAVVSETAPGGAPTRIRFLSRNRLIAALTQGTVVVEAAVRSGALNTANWASRLNRVLLGVPGPITSAPSQGVHQLIRTGAAALVTSGADVLEAVGTSGEHLVATPRGRERPRDHLTPRQRQVLDAVPVAHSARADSIARAAGVGLLEVGSALIKLEERELVEPDEGGWRLAARAHT
jgi:DNA processing protein